MQDSSGAALQADGAAAAAAREEHFGPTAELALRLAAAPPPRVALTQLVNAVVASSDPVLATCVFRDLINSGYGGALVNAVPESPILERHLLALGHERPYTIPWSELGRSLQEPVSAVALTHMELLAKLYTTRKEIGRAVEVLAAMGRASVDAAVPPAKRPDRVQLFGDAKLHVRHPIVPCGPSQG